MASFFGANFFGGSYFKTEAPPEVISGASNVDWLKAKRRKPKVIRRSDFANQEEYRDAMREALASVPLSQVRIPDPIEAEDDDALLAVMLRVLH